MNDIRHLPGSAEAKAVIRQHRKASFYVKKYLMIFLGALIAAIGLELFLIPNNVIDGGIVGISIMMSSITGLSLGVFLVLLNIPFLYLGTAHDHGPGGYGGIPGGYGRQKRAGGGAGQKSRLAAGACPVGRGELRGGLPGRDAHL